MSGKYQTSMVTALYGRRMTRINRAAVVSTTVSVDVRMGKGSAGGHAVAGAGGFTLLELLLAVAILAGMMAITWPSFARHLSRQNLHESADRIQSLAFYCRAYASSEVRRYRLTWEEPHGNPKILVEAEPYEQPGVFEDATASWTRNVQLLDGVEVEWVQKKSLAPDELLALQTGLGDEEDIEEDAQWRWIEFRPDGTCDSASIWLLGSEQRRIVLDVTGVTADVVKRIPTEDQIDEYADYLKVDMDE